jgi:glycerophosphoryl diester phosphodiesterase
MDNKLIERTLISSFNPLDLFVIRRYAADMELGLLVPPGKNRYWSEFISGKFVNFNSIHFDFRYITEDLIEKYRKKKKSVFAYTVNNSKNIQKLIDIGIDGIFTDNPLLAKQLIKRI